MGLFGPPPAKPCYNLSAMRPHVIEFNEFYATRLGHVSRRLIRQSIRAVWPSVRGEAVLGLGYATPYLGLFREEAERVVAVMPAGQGVMPWPSHRRRLVAIARVSAAASRDSGAPLLRKPRRLTNQHDWLTRIEQFC